MNIELHPLLDEPVTITTASGRVLKANPELSGQEALIFVSGGTGDMGANLRSWAAIISRCISSVPGDDGTYTPERVLDEFSMAHMAQILGSFLALNGQVPSSMGTENRETRRKQPKKG